MRSEIQPSEGAALLSREALLRRPRRRARGRTILSLILIPALLAALSCFAQDAPAGDKSVSPAPVKPTPKPTPKPAPDGDSKDDGEAGGAEEEPAKDRKADKGAKDARDAGAGVATVDESKDESRPLRDPTRPSGASAPMQPVASLGSEPRGRLLLPELQLVARLSIEGRAMVALIRVDGQIQRLREGDRCTVLGRRTGAAARSRGPARGGSRGVARGAASASQRRSRRSTPSSPGATTETVTLQVQTLTAERVVLVPVGADGGELAEGAAATVILR